MHTFKQGILDWFNILLGFFLGVMLTLLTVKFAYADTWINFGGPSHHVDRSERVNEKNLGIGMHFDLTDRAGLAFGAYRNSEFNNTGYIVAPYLYRFGALSAGTLQGGVFGGYDKRIMFLPPVPTVRLQLGNHALNASYIPPHDGDWNVFWVTYEYRINH